MTSFTTIARRLLPAMAALLFTTVVATTTCPAQATTIGPRVGVSAIEGGDARQAEAPRQTSEQPSSLELEPTDDALLARSESHRRRAGRLYIGAAVSGLIGAVTTAASLVALFGSDDVSCSSGACGNYAAAYALIGGSLVLAHAVILLIPAIILNVQANRLRSASLALEAGPASLGVRLKAGF